MTTELRPTPEVNAHRDDMNHYEFDEELALTYELAKKLERERDEAREQLEAMREAIKEAHEALMLAPYRDQEALAKLQPFSND